MAELRVQVQFDSLTPAHKVPDKQGRTEGKALPACPDVIHSVNHASASVLGIIP